MAPTNLSNDPKIIYAVTAGEYSDYGVCGIFSSEENAKSYMEAFPKKGYGGYNEIEKWTLDEHLDEIRRGLINWLVYMYRDGDVHEVRRQDSAPGGYFTEPHWNQNGWWNPPKPWALFEVWAESKEAAIKIANERRIQALAKESLTALDVSK